MSEENLNEEFDIITMTDEDGNDHDFFIVDAVNVDNQTYILVVDATADPDDEEAEALILKETGVDGENSIFDIIEDEEEFEKVLKLFEENDDFDIK